MRIILDYIFFSEHIIIGIAIIIFSLVASYFTFRKIPILSILLSLFGIYLGMYCWYMPTSLLQSVVDGFNSQVLVTNDPSRQKILDIKKIDKNIIYYQVHHQDKLCLQKDIPKIKDGTVFYGIWNSASKIGYKNKVIKPGKCSKLESELQFDCNKKSINKCLDLFYNKYYF